MSIFRDHLGKASAGRSLGTLTLAAGILAFAVGFWLSSQHDYAYRTGMALVLTGWGIFTGGKGLETIQGAVKAFQSYFQGVQ